MTAARNKNALVFYNLLCLVPMCDAASWFAADGKVVDAVAPALDNVGDVLALSVLDLLEEPVVLLPAAVKSSFLLLALLFLSGVR